MNERYKKCPECGKYAVHTAKREVLEFVGDRDDSTLEKSIYYDEHLELQDSILVVVCACFECGHLVDVDIESLREEAIDTREYQWSAECPVESGKYWFYGWTGRMRDSKATMHLVYIRVVSGGALCLHTHGELFSEKRCLGLWTSANFPLKLPTTLAPCN